MVDEKTTEHALRLEIDTLLLDMSFDEANNLVDICNNSEDAELINAHWNYDDDMASSRPNNDGLRKYLDVIRTVRKIDQY